MFDSLSHYLILQEIPDHIQSAIATAAEFQELIDNLEAFPSKVKVSLENMKRGFWQKLWDFIRQAASFLWDVCDCSCLYYGCLGRSD